MNVLNSPNARDNLLCSRLPEGWKTTRLKYLGHFVGGGTPSKDNSEFWKGDIPWVSPKDMKCDVVTDSEDHISQKGLSSSSTTLLTAGCLLFVVRSGILKHSIPAAVNLVPVALNQDIRALVPNGKADVHYLRYIITGNQNDLLPIWRKIGATVESLEYEFFANATIPVPSLGEQRSIVKFLDGKTAQIDALIAKKRRMIDLLHEKRQALISEAVTKGLEPDTPMKDSAIEWLTQIPTHWVVSLLKRTAKEGYRTFIDGDWIETPYITKEGVRLIQTGNIGIGYYKEQGFRFVAKETFDELRCTEVLPDDVLICRLDGPVGRASLAPDLGCKMITSVDVTILKPSPDQDPRFLVYLLTFRPYLDWVGSLCRVGGGHRYRISRTMLGDFRVPLPPLSEQVEIADHLDREIGELDSLCMLIESQAEKLREYRQTLIAAAVTGQLDVCVEAGA